MAVQIVHTIASNKTPAQKGSKYQIKQLLRLVQNQVVKSEAATPKKRKKPVAA
ncbi:hypothetical protein RYA05_00125 [Pseudomonas syringae pv. actinidiae]|nr:hypothetical protein [Pseudomonas syringae pv. actinidiae]